MTADYLERGKDKDEARKMVEEEEKKRKTHP